MNYKEMGFLISRYFILMLLAINSLYLFYAVFTPLTLYPSYLVLKSIYSNAILNAGIGTISFGEDSIELIQACIAGAAYYLLIILNLTTPMSLKMRIKSIFFLILTFLFLNITRIVVFSVLFLNGAGYYFDLAHKLVWYAGSTILIVLLWFANVKLFNLQTVPVYTDWKGIIEDIFPRER
ncbi:MAG: pacearchaeosortase [Nanoarchaeota archaeon]